MTEYGDKLVPIEVDLSKPNTISAAAATAADVDFVVNNAGVLTATNPLDEKAIDSLAFEMDVNVNGLIRMAQAFAPVLKANGGGAFAQLNSVASLRSFAGFSTYCASKAASYGITQALREVLSEQGTHVISVHPGPIATDMAADAGFDVADPPSMVSDSILEALKTKSFLAFPDSMAQQVGGTYQSFAEAVILPSMAE